MWPEELLEGEKSVVVSIIWEIAYRWFGQWSEGSTAAMAAGEPSGFKNGDSGALGCVPRRSPFEETES